MTVAEQLAAADPLVHEGPLAADVVTAQRRAVLRHARGSSTAVARPATGRSPRVALSGAAVVLAMLVAGWSVWRVSPPALAAVRLEIRLAEERQAPGLIQAPVVGSGRTVYMHADTVITNEDVAHASVIAGASASRFNVDVQLTALGAAKLQQATAVHIGRPVAFLLDGQVIMAPIVRSPIGEAATISGNYTREEAERIAGGLRVR